LAIVWLLERKIESLLWIRIHGAGGKQLVKNDKTQGQIQADDCIHGVTAQSESVMQVMRRWRLPQNTPQENHRSVRSALVQVFNRRRHDNIFPS